MLSEEPYDELVGKGTPGYWKNHPEAWPVEELDIECESYISAEAIDIMNLLVKSYKWFPMFNAYVATRLNVLSGTNPDPHAGVLEDAEDWLCNTSLKDSKANLDAWKLEGEDLAELFDLYNKGLLPGALLREILWNSLLPD